MYHFIEAYLTTEFIGWFCWVVKILLVCPATDARVCFGNGASVSLPTG